MSLPMSLRTAAGERAYQEARLNGGTRPLELEPSIKKWQYWRLIENRFPYSVAFKTHHMLVPYRANVSERWDLNDEEKREFERILREFVYPTYDLWFENCPKRRSVARFYHVHLASYVDSREQMSL